MSDVVQLREQLESLGFHLLDNDGREVTGVLKVEVWIRYSPHSIISLPVRGADESNESFNSRLEKASELIVEAAQLDAAPEFGNDDADQHRIASMSEVDNIANGVPQEEYVNDNDDLEVPSGSDYYQYTPPVVETPVEPEPDIVAPEFDEVIAESETANIETTYEPEAPSASGGLDRDSLLKARRTLQTAIDEIDAILAPK